MSEMNLQRGLEDLRFILEHAAQILGEPVRPCSLYWELSNAVQQRCRFTRTLGIDGLPPIYTFNSGAIGRTVDCGLQEVDVRTDNGVIPALRLCNPFDGTCGDTFNQVWLIPARDYARFYRFARRLGETTLQTVSPIMDPDEQKRLWDHTIGFLETGEAALKRFGIAVKRGVLLMGDPGNGKTMACRWLQAEAASRGYEWRNVTVENFEAHRTHGSASTLFDLSSPGFVMFDDFDAGLRHRDQTGGTSPEHSLFLAELDGLKVRHGVVFLFTSNARLSELDPAFRRPGRIDQVIHFPQPDAQLRRRLLVEAWPREITVAIPLDEVVAATGGCSFAEIDELKKLLVLRYLETDAWDWPWVWQEFRNRLDEARHARPLGFHAVA